MNKKAKSLLSVIIVLLVVFVMFFFLKGILVQADGGTCGGTVACTCGDTLTSSRTLNASDSLTNCNTTFILNITSQNVTLDCDNFLVSGNGSNSGISICATNATIENCIINNTNYGVYGTNTGSFFDFEYGAKVFNSLISNSASYDVFLNGSGESDVRIILTNVSYSTESVTSGNKLFRRWYIDVQVNSSLGDPLENVNVSTYDTNGSISTGYYYIGYSSLTDSNGRTKQPVTSYLLSGSTYTYYSNYSINATYLGTDGNSTSVNLTDNQEIFFTLLMPPVVNLVYPEDDYEYNSSVVNIIYNVSYDGTIENCSLIINNEMNETDEDVTVDQNETINTTLPSGNYYNWSVNCTSSNGQVGQSETRQILVNILGECGYRVTSDQTLDQDITGCSSNHALIFATNNVTFDCAGHTIEGTFTYGVYGAHFSGAQNTRLINCTIKNFQRGVNFYISNSDRTRNTTLENNNLTNNTYNFYIHDGSSGDINDYYHNIDATNLAEGRPIYYLHEISDIEYNESTNASFFACVNCDNITIKNLNLSTKNSEGIYLRASTNCIIQNNTISDNYRGIDVLSSNSNNITQNNIFENDLRGINVEGDTNNIFNNTFSSNDKGIYLSYSDDNIVYNNSFQDNNWGMGLGSSTNNNTIHSNSFLDNVAYGVYVSNLAGSLNPNLIYNNYFENNNVNAYQQTTSWPQDWNTTYSCSENSSQNIILGDCLGGNYWQDYNGDDDGSGSYPYNTSGDGIGDTEIPYNSSGTIADYFPLVEEIETILVNVTLIYPENAQLLTTNSTTLNYTVNVESNCSVYHNKTGNWFADCSTNGTTGDSCEITNLDNGVYMWNVYCIDSTNDTNSDWADSNYTFTVSLANEEINVTLIYPENETNFNTTNNFSINYSTNLEANCTLYVWNSSALFSETSTTLVNGSWSVNFNGFLNENYSWNVYCLDASNASNDDWGDESNWIFIVNYSVDEEEEEENLSISVNKTVLNSGTIYVDDIVRYLINITNTGSINITNLTIIDSYDVDLNYSNSSTTPTSVNYSGRIINLSNILTENLEPNSSSLVYVNLTAIGSAPSVFNTANVTAIDSEGNTTYNNFSKTITINETEESQNITVTLNSPGNEEEIEKSSFPASQDFSWTAEDKVNETMNCSIYLGDSYQESIECTNNSDCLTTLEDLEEQTYSWQINCSDFEGNNEVSEEYTFTLNMESSGGGGGGGGGGGTGEEENQTNVTNQTNQTIFNQTVLDNYDLGELETEKESSAGKDEGIKFTISEEQHTIKIVNFSESGVTLLIWSNPIQVYVPKGETKNVDIDQDGIADISIEYVGITDNKVDLIIKKISEPIETEEEIIESNKSIWPWFLIGVIAIIAVLIIYFAFASRAKKKCH